MAHSVQELSQALEEGSLVLLDVRPGHHYAKAHVPRSVSVPFTRWGWGRTVRRWLKEQGIEQVAILADNAVVAEAARAALEAEGLSPKAVFDQGLASWEDAGLPLVMVVDLTVQQLREEQPHWTVVDVREPFEWRSGIIPGALTIPLGHLPGHLERLEKHRRYAMVCASGNRSQTAAAFLAEHGFRVANVVGGMKMWLAAGHPVQSPE
jgi:rhodanese-related sulfurtransferase